MRSAELYLGDRTYLLRDAEERDVSAIAALLADDGIGATREDAGDPAPYLAAFRAIEADPAHLLLVAEALDGAVAGTLQLSLLPGLSWHGALRAQIEGVRVAPAHRGGALGSVLVRWASDEARSRGAGLVQLTTDRRRADAIRFYGRLGFSATHVGLKRVFEGRRTGSSAVFGAR